MLGSLFEMFVEDAASGSQRSSGLGFGLSLVQRLVELHSGSVRAISDGITGSEFIIDLPLDAPSSAADGEDVTVPPAVVLPKRILIIDDNADAADALAMLLAIQGQEVETRRDGMSGVAAAATFKPDVVLIDIGLGRRRRL